MLQRDVVESDEMQQFEDVAWDAPRPPLPPSPINPADCSQAPHHAPAAAACHPRWEGDPNQAAAASDLETLEEVRRRRAAGPSPSDITGGGGGRGCARVDGRSGGGNTGSGGRGPVYTVNGLNKDYTVWINVLSPYTRPIMEVPKVYSPQ